jgi:hypothetical protein
MDGWMDGWMDGFSIFVETGSIENWLPKYSSHEGGYIFKKK